VRILLLTFGLVIGGLGVILWVLVVMTLFTVLQRLYVARQKLIESGDP
jgi:hypothetical protein